MYLSNSTISISLKPSYESYFLIAPGLSPISYNRLQLIPALVINNGFHSEIHLKDCEINIIFDKCMGFIGSRSEITIYKESIEIASMQEELLLKLSNTSSRKICSWHSTFRILHDENQFEVSTGLIKFGETFLFHV